MTEKEISAVMDPKNFIGCAKEQTANYLKNIVRPLLNKNRKLLGIKSKIEI